MRLVLLVNVAAGDGLTRHFCDSNIQEQVWNWLYEGIDHYFDIGEIVRFRVEAEHWHDNTSGAPASEETNTGRKTPYSITVSPDFPEQCDFRC